MLLIFDNDGTICDTQQVEGRCYAMAIDLVTGLSLSSVDWNSFQERTSSAIVRQLLSADGAWQDKEERIKHEFCRLLRDARPQFPADFSPIVGAIEFIERLRWARTPVAIATGGFDKEAEFKLACCGLSLQDFPYATASDTSRRRDIIRLACARAGSELDSAVYFGDAPWDVRVTSELGIPMIGIGRRCDQLRDHSHCDRRNSATPLTPTTDVPINSSDSISLRFHKETRHGSRNGSSFEAPLWTERDVLHSMR